MFSKLSFHGAMCKPIFIHSSMVFVVVFIEFIAVAMIFIYLAMVDQKAYICDKHRKVKWF